MNRKKIQSNKGLTLIETLVAISILLIAVVGPMAIYSRSISDARFAGNQVTAFYLAQEAMEFIKAKVYTNFNESTQAVPVSWLTGLDSCTTANDCKVDIPEDKINWTGSPEPSWGLNLKYDDINGLYNYTSGSDTVFSRSVDINDTGSGEATLTVVVSWTNSGVSKSISVKETMFDWQ